MDIIDINKLWDSFFYPLMQSIIFTVSMVIIWGKDNCRSFLIGIGKKADSFIYGSNKPNKNSRNKKDKYDTNASSLDSNAMPKTLNIFKKGIQELVKKPATWFFLLFLLSFALSKLIMFHANRLYPITYSMSQTQIAAEVVDSSIMAEIWANYPNLDFDSVCNKINEFGIKSDYVANYDWSFGINLICVVEFISTICFIILIVNMIKKRWTKVLRPAIGLALSLLVVFVLLFSQYLTHKKLFQQSAFQALETVRLSNVETIDSKVLNDFRRKVDSEYSSLRINNSNLYEGFSIKLQLPFH